MSKIILLAVVWLVGCAAGEEADNSTKAENCTNNIVYVKDTRTGICFATYAWGYFDETMATVPCEAIPPGLLTKPKGKWVDK
jgi:hypothetical protein